MAEFHNHESLPHESGLVDGCPRCEQLAARPLSMDQQTIRTIWYGYFIDSTIQGKLNIRVIDTLQEVFVLSRKMGWHDIRNFTDGDTR